ncbi:sigma-70 family RNA polymerase sigma factor [Conexibacter sp. SYSU D00693]|uniref:sigma-70 family RNA polymerase sigma factor n=1 Tax=Conexibacter sp. SYSU D00693 TaxID=2812560 RepID=UPI00196B6AD4|nr:sigma-70 family RNA polymerase sigma factor [Conexibacter sp. SYSU D00693]
MSRTASSLSPAARRIAPGKDGRLSSDSLLALWMELRATGDPQVRDRLVLTFAPLVKYIVYRKVREVPAHLEVEDFLSCGLEAVMSSLDRYDPLKGATLEQFLYTRIHGAVLDELRRQDWAPRSVRRLQRDVTKVESDFRALHRREPTEEETAEAAGLSVRELRDLRHDLVRAEPSSLDETVDAGEPGGSIMRVDTVEADDLEAEPEHQAMKAAAKERFREAFATLSEREREIAVLLYVEHLTGAEVGEVVGVTESRVSQIHTGIKKKLRLALTEHRGLFAA